MTKEEIRKEIKSERQACAHIAHSALLCGDIKLYERMDERVDAMEWVLFLLEEPEEEE